MRNAEVWSSLPHILKKYISPQITNNKKRPVKHQKNLIFPKIDENVSKAWLCASLEPLKPL